MSGNEFQRMIEDRGHSTMSAIPASRDTAGRLRQAVDEFRERASRSRKPGGDWIQGLWYPSEQERMPCCDEITPTPANKQALQNHCRSQRHIANLFGVELEELKRALKAVPEEEPLRPRLVPGSSPARGSKAESLYRASQEARIEAVRDLIEEARNTRLTLELLAASTPPRMIESDLEALLAEIDEAATRLRKHVEVVRLMEATFKNAVSVRAAYGRTLSQEGE